MVILKPEHARAVGKGYVLAHILIAEHVLGHPLPFGAEVHHVNKVRSDNRHANLVICQSRAYHILLHQRQTALSAGFQAHWRKCTLCQTYDAPSNLRIDVHKLRSAYHLSCAAAQAKINYVKRMSHANA